MKKVIYSVFVLTLLIACNRHQEHNNHATNVNNHVEIASETLELNNGLKWKVNDSTLQHITEMEKTIQNFKIAPPSHYAELSANLKKSVQLVIATCTMEGKAHEELHKWLIPYINVVDKLTASKSDEESSKLLIELKDSFETFNFYFE